MKRSISILTFAALTVAANAQCLVSSGTSIIGSFTATGGFPANDEGVSPIQPLGFTIDINGTLYDHCYIGTNGMVELVVGAAAPTTWMDVSTFGIATLAELQGAAGDNPLFCPWSDDMFVGDILVDATIPGEFKITWVDASAYLQTDVFDFQCTLNTSGAIYSYGLDDYTDSFAANVVIGASYGDMAGTGTEPETEFLIAGDTGAVGVVYEQLSALSGELPSPDILDLSLLMAINGSGGFAHGIVCGTPPNPPAAHIPSGTGCYPINEIGEVYQIFADPTVAEAALENTSLVYTPNADSGYTITAGTATLRSTAAATPFALANDAQNTLFLPAAFNWRGVNPVATMVIAANGYIASSNTVFTFPYDVDGEFGTQGADAIVAWGNDLQPATSGAVFIESDPGTGMFYITFDDVPQFVSTVTGGGGDVTFQYQLELATGVCTVVYGDIFDTDPTTGTDPVGIGFSVADAPAVPPSIDIATDLPASCFGAEFIVPGIVLDADVPAISTPTTGTTVTYSAVGAPDFLPTALPGLKLGVLIASFLPATGGIDIGLIFGTGPWNCSAFVASLDSIIAFPTVAPFEVPIPYPAGVPPLTELTFQAAFLLDSNDPTWAASDAGLVGNDFLQTSNALTTRLSDN